MKLTLIHSKIGQKEFDFFLDFVEHLSQIACLVKFRLLDLPEDRGRRVGSMSGGQKRRVSLGAALIARPSLLLLDEPTVGVDPLLRKSIWQHLVNTVKDTKVRTNEKHSCFTIQPSLVNAKLSQRGIFTAMRIG